MTLAAFKGRCYTCGHDHGDNSIGGTTNGYPTYYQKFNELKNQVNSLLNLAGVGSIVELEHKLLQSQKDFSLATDLIRMARDIDRLENDPYDGTDFQSDFDVWFYKERGV